MENVSNHVRSHVPPHTSAQGAHYSAQQIADMHPDISPAEVTVRTRWFEAISKVAPKELLKTGPKFTELARSLFDDYVYNVKQGTLSLDDWIHDAKTRYAHEWESAGVIDAELMPDGVGSSLATLRNTGNSLQMRMAAELEQLNEFVGQLQEVEADFSEAELNLFKARGAMRGVKRFKVETQSELEIYSQLRQQNLNNQQ